MEDRLGVDDLLTDVAKLRTWITAASGVGPAPNDAQYVVLALHADLTAERVLTAGNSITVTDGGAGLAVTVALTTPGTCAVASVNSAVAPHTHAITTTVVGAASTIVATDANGRTQVDGLGINVAAAADGQITFSDGGGIGATGGVLVTWDLTDNYLEITGCSVGIGTTTPQKALHVWIGDAGADPIWGVVDCVIFEGSGNVNTQYFCPANCKGSIGFSDPDARSVGYVSYDHATDCLSLAANSATVLALDTNAYALVGGMVVSLDTATFQVRATNKDTKGAIVRGRASQAQNLQEWQNNVPATLTAIEPDGDLWFASGIGIVCAAGVTAGLVLRANGTRFVPASIATGDVAALAAQFVCLAASADLANERVLTAGNSITVTDAGAGAAVTVALATPGTCTATSTNSAVAPHTHAIDATLARSAITITAGAGLPGGGDLTANRTLTVGAGNGITVNADDVALTTPGTCTATSTNSAAGSHTHAIDATLARSAITITAGAGLTGGGDLTANRTLTVGAGAGITVNADDVALTTPGTCTTTSTNSAAGSHTHAVTTTTAGAASTIVATEANGRTTLHGLGVGTAATTDHCIDVASAGWIGLSSTTGRIIFTRNVAGIVDTLTITAGQLYVNETTNTFMSDVGITIASGSEDEHFAIKNTNFAHGITDNAETDTLFTISKSIAASGGANLIGYSSASLGILLAGRAVTDITTKTTAALGYVVLTAQKKSSATVGDCGADANLVVIRNNATTRFIFDAEGSAHADVEWTTFDEHDDLALLGALVEAATAHRRNEGKVGDEQRQYRRDMEVLGIARFDDDRPDRTMINLSRLPMLLLGAIQQLERRVS